MRRSFTVLGIFVFGLVGCSDEAIPLEDMGTMVQDDDRGDAFIPSMTVDGGGQDTGTGNDAEDDARAQEISLWADDVDELIDGMGQLSLIHI